MDFFQAQEDARRKTVWLVFMMGAAVVSLVLLTTLLVALFLWYGQQSVGMMNPVGFYFTPELFLVCLLIIGGVVLVGSLIKLASLGRGSDALIVAMGGRCIPPEPTDLREAVLRNLVEEIAIASGAPIPNVYVLDDEPSINAFAAGFSLNDAALGFTKGSVQRLSRGELEGVVAHEFSHLVHGDSRLNLKLMGVLHGITMISNLGYQMLRSQRYRSRSSRDGASISLAGIALLMVGYSGVFFASLIRSAVSRQREFLADASAVQYTRNMDGLADALKRIGGQSSGREMVTPIAAGASHMMFSQAVSNWIGGLFNTHPPLPDRILRLQPHWNQQFLSEESSGPAKPGMESAQSQGAISSLSGDGDLSLHEQVDPQRVGNAGHVERTNARQLIAELPTRLLNSAHSSDNHAVIIYGLLLHPDSGMREKQLRLLRNEVSGGLFMLLCGECKLIDTLNPLQRLPLLNIALATQKQGAQTDITVVESLIPTLIGKLIAVDGKVSTFEWAMQVLVRQQLQTRPNEKVTRVAAQLRNLRLLFSYLLSASHMSEEQRLEASKVAYMVMGVKDVGCIGANRLKPLDVTVALLALANLRIKDKKQLMSACQGIVLSDKKLLPAELEVLRTIAEVLGCPLPLLSIHSRR